jgi:MFS family permease
MMRKGVRIMSVVQTHVEPSIDQRRVWIIFSGLMLALLIASLDQTIVATALPTIVSDLGGLNQLSWVVTGYLTSSTVSTPLWGKLVGRLPSPVRLHMLPKSLTSYVR